MKKPETERLQHRWEIRAHSFAPAPMAPGGFPEVVPESSATGINSRGLETNITACSVTGAETSLW